MSKRSRTPLDDYLWPIFVAACGGHCVDCGKGEADDLQRGHIQRDHDDGPDTLDNLQPLCAVCNGRYNQHFSMPDLRPSEWRSNFIKLLAQALRTELVVTGVAQPSPKNDQRLHTPETGKPIENTEVISWERINFAFNSVLSLPLLTLAHPYPLEQYIALVEKAIRNGAAHEDAPIPPPDEHCKNKLCNLVRKLGRDDFVRAFREFLLQEKWYDQDSRGIRRVMLQPWNTFADNLALYLEDASKRAQRKAQADAAMAAVERQLEAERLEGRWNSLRSCADIPEWPGMTDDDKAFIVNCRALPSEQQIVSEEDDTRARDIWYRHREYEREKSKTKKSQLLEGIQRIRERAFKDLFAGNIDPTDEETKAALRGFNRVAELVKGASDNGPELITYQRELGKIVNRFKVPRSH